jgi:hypothetical protein
MNFPIGTLVYLISAPHYLDDKRLLSVQTGLDDHRVAQASRPVLVLPA